jgi:hypothetical protein
MDNPVVSELLVARGFIPVRLRSSRKTIQLGSTGKMCSQDLGPLRSPAGINPLATSNSYTTDSWLNSLRHKKGQSRQGLPFLFAAINHVGAKP